MIKNKKISRHHYLLCVTYCVIVLSLLCGVAQLVLLNYRFDQTIDKNSYQAVFLTNGQVYFGHLEFVRRDYLVLNDVYYVQLDQSLQSQTADSAVNTNSENQFVLYKLGEELHQPQNQMIINRDHLMFWENLKTDSQIITAIQERAN